MCGRFVSTSSPEEIARVFDVEHVADDVLRPSWNVAPTRDVWTVMERSDGTRGLTVSRWGLVPSWAKDPGMGAKMINARSETAHEKPAYRSAFERRRCLVPADGFYEWRTLADTKTKQPVFFSSPDAEPLGLAGLWENWKDAEGRVLRTCTILTCEANDVVGPVHDRMPVLLEAERWSAWLDPSCEDTEALRSLLAPAPGSALVAREVSTAVNNARNDGPELLDAPDASEPGDQA